MLTIYLLLFIAFSQVIISLGIFLGGREKKDISQKLFVALSFIILLWTAINTALLYVDAPNGVQYLKYFNFANKAGFTLGAISLLLVYIFCLFYPVAKKGNYYQKLIIGAGIALVLLAPFDVLAGSFRAEGTGLHYVTGTLSPLFALFALLVLIAIYKESADALRLISSRAVKNQTITLMVGLTLTIAHAVIFIIIVPTFISDNTTIYATGYLAPYFFMGATVYSLLRQNLFDLRLIVARTVAYVLLLGTSAVIFASLVIALPASLIGIDKPNTARQVYYTLSAVVLAFVFQPLKKFFDKATNRIFYQDAYEAQSLYDELNQVLVSTVDLELMLKSSASVIEKNLKPEFCVFGLKETEYEKQRIIGQNAPKFNKDDIDFAKKITPGIDHKVIVADYLEDSDKDLQRRMRKNDVAALVRITSDLGQEGVGYIVLGAKKSGNPYSSQDIRVLETIANSMVIAIDNALRFEEIQKFNITLEQKVEDATRKLQKANDKLIALDQTKDDFISMASHQLRTPLTSVKGYLSMVLEGDAGKVNPRQEKLLDQAFVSSQRMVYLIADLLNVSRLRTGKFVIEPAEVDLSVIVDEEVKQLQETAEAKNLKLEYKKPKNFPALMLDETKIRQVAMNFIDNAIYYTPSGGKITVELKDTGKTVEYTVKDSGIGVPKHEQHNLFTKFFRAKNARKARPDGTGLGLFMAKKVVVAQGGAVLFSSQEGKGSTFGFTFDKAKLLPMNSNK